MTPHRLLLPNHRATALGVLLSALMITAQARASTVSIVGGTSDPVNVQVTGKSRMAQYFRLLVGGSRLQIKATGPVTLSIRFRATGAGRASGVLRILRDDGPFSDNPYDLAHDSTATPDFNAAVEDGAVSVERVIHVRVDDGDHRYEISAVKGRALLVRVFKTSKFDPALAAAPEKNTDAVATPPPPQPAVQKAPPQQEAAAATPATPAANPSATPPPATPPPANDSPTTETLQEQSSSSPSADGEEAVNAEDLPEVPAAPVPVNEHSGLGIGVRMGALGFLGFARHSGVGTGPLKLSNRVWGYTPLALEFAWDVNGTWSLFIEGSNVEATRKFTTTVVNNSESGSVHVTSDYRLVPVVLGVTAFVPVGSRLGFRFRAGVGASFAGALSSPTEASPLANNGTYQSTWLPAGTAGAAFEVRLGPGRFSLEARYLFLSTTWFSTSPVNGFNAFPADLGGLELLAGYRFELF